MTLISTGSTLMFIFSSHLMDALIAARGPSSSKHTIPISSVTLACRTLGMTGNLWLNCQITGVVISFGGYISHRRVFCMPTESRVLAGADLLAVLGLLINGIGRSLDIGDWALESRDAARSWNVRSSCSTALRGCMCSSAGDRRDDADFIAVFQFGLLVFKATDVFLVYVHVDESADRAGVVQQPFLEPGIAGLELGDHALNGGSVHFHNFLVVSQLPQWSGYSYFFGHKSVRRTRCRVFQRPAGPQIHAGSA